jgi:hydroxyacylglutathione hydrolase
MGLSIHQFGCLSDNYGYLVRCDSTGACTTIDTPDPRVILSEAEKLGWHVGEVWNTHHHYDHAGGNEAMSAAGAKISAPASEADKIPAVDRLVSPGDTLKLGEFEAQVIDVGGHTLGHIAYWFESENIAFVGDSLFALGCGRMFEGTAEQFHASLSRLRALPPETVIYCAHEYTEANLAFAMSIDGENPDLLAYGHNVRTKRSNQQPTVPSLLRDELAANPFLRWDNPDLRARLGLESASDVEVFAEIRHRKDVF